MFSKNERKYTRAWHFRHDDYQLNHNKVIKARTYISTSSTSSTYSTCLTFSAFTIKFSIVIMMMIFNVMNRLDYIYNCLLSVLFWLKTINSTQTRN